VSAIKLTLTRQQAQCLRDALDHVSFKTTELNAAAEGVVDRLRHEGILGYCGSMTTVRSVRTLASGWVSAAEDRPRM
jgi:hypothetical protein